MNEFEHLPVGDVGVGTSERAGKGEGLQQDVFQALHGMSFTVYLKRQISFTSVH